MPQAPQLIGEATAFWWSHRLFNNSDSCESCFAVFGGDTYFFYNATGNTCAVISYNAATVGQSLPQNTQIVSGVCRFFNIVPDRGVYYLTGGKIGGGGPRYMWQCTGNPSVASNWGEANGGAPILNYAAGTPIASHIYNDSIVPVGDVWHYFVEANGGIYHSAEVAYPVSTPPISFNTNFNSTCIIPGGGSPDARLTSDCKSIIMFHAVSGDRFNGADYLTVSMADLSDDLNDPTSWRTYKDTFCVGETNVLVADPAVLDGWDGLNIYVSYDQNQIRQLSRKTSLSSFVAALRGS